MGARILKRDILTGPMFFFLKVYYPCKYGKSRKKDILRISRMDSNPQPSDRQSEIDHVSAYVTRSEKVFFWRKRGLQVVNKWTYK